MNLYLVLGIILIILYVTYRINIRHLVTASKLFPGPFSWPIIGNALVLAGSSEEVFNRFSGYCYYYCKSFRIWMVHKLFICCIVPEHAEVVLGNNTEITKGEVYDFLFPWIGEGLLTSSGSKWRSHRKMLTPAFHFKILSEMVQTFHRNGEILCEVLSYLPEGKVFDVYNYVKMYALDNICEAAMGVSIDAQRNPNSAYIKAIKDICTVVFERMRKIWFRSDFIFKMSKWAKMQKEALKIIHGTTMDVIKKRKEEIAKNPDLKLKFENDEFSSKGKLAFLDILLHSADEYGLTDEDIREEVDTFMFEGHDTVTSGISFSLYYIAKYPEVQKKILEEMDSILEGENREATVRDLQAMKYLEQVIKESLRLHPSVPIVGRKIKEDLQLDDKLYAPKGSEILLMIVALHRHPHFWENGEEFHPERFSPEEVQKRHPYLFVPFSAGPRNCIGQKFAMLEMKSAISKLVKEFELLPSPNPEHEIVQIPELVLTSGTGMHIRVKRREN